jgi:hypothetical protein
VDIRKPGGRCMYTVTLRLIRAAIIVVDKKWVLCNLSACICKFRHPACSAHAPYCHLVDFHALQYFSTLSHKRHS